MGATMRRTLKVVQVSREPLIIISQEANIVRIRGSVPATYRLHVTAAPRAAGEYEHDGCSRGYQRHAPTDNDELIWFLSSAPRVHRQTDRQTVGLQAQSLKFDCLFVCLSDLYSRPK